MLHTLFPLLQNIVNSYDLNNDGRLDYNEFLNYMMDKEKKWKIHFDEIDRDKCGKGSFVFQCQTGLWSDSHSRSMANCALCAGPRLSVTPSLLLSLWWWHVEHMSFEAILT